MSSTTPEAPEVNRAADGRGVKRGPDRELSADEGQDKDNKVEETISAPPAKVAKTSTDSTKEIATPEKAEACAEETVVKTGAEKVISAGPSDSDKVEEEALREIGLTVGTRIEVMWLLEEDDKSTEKWWGCSVTGAVKGERDDCGRPVFTLHYDAFEAFEEAHHQVAFIDGYRLVHLEDGAEMTWKMEGQEVDREALMASLSDEPVDLQEMVRAQEQDEEEEGDESMESRGMRELAQLPFHQQIAMAEGFRRMTDVVKEHLRAKVERQGGGEVVVSAEDIKNIFREVRAGGPSEH